MYKVVILPKAKKQLLEFNSKDYYRIEKKILELKKFLQVSNLKKLRGFKDYFK